MSEPYDWTKHLNTNDPDAELAPFAVWEAKGTVVVGTVTKIEDREDKKYGKGMLPYLEVDTEDGPLAINGGPIRLRWALAEQNPQLGDVLKIRYDGKETLPSGNTVKLFTVKVEKAEPVEDGTEPF